MAVCFKDRTWSSGYYVDIPVDTPDSLMEAVGLEAFHKVYTLAREVKRVWLYNSHDDSAPEESDRVRISAVVEIDKVDSNLAQMVGAFVRTLGAVVEESERCNMWSAKVVQDELPNFEVVSGYKDSSGQWINILCGFCGKNCPTEEDAVASFGDVASNCEHGHCIKSGRYVSACHDCAQSHMSYNADCDMWDLNSGVPLPEIFQEHLTNLETEVVRDCQK